MLTWLRTWLDARRRKLEIRRREAAARSRALAEFQKSRGVSPMGAHVVRIDTHAAIVRVMYPTDHIPPGRAWFRVAEDGGDVRELSFDDVRELETPWR